MSSIEMPVKSVRYKLCHRTAVLLSGALCALLVLASVTVRVVYARGIDEKSESPRVVPLMRAHAHNDFQHTRPLLDALDCGFSSVEADVYSEAGN